MTTTTHEHTKNCWWNPDHAAWVCGETLDERPLVDVRDMLVVHTALLREFRLAPAAVGRIAAGDRRQAGRVDAHLGFVCDLLHHHHQGEDELLWPKLIERVSPAARASIDAVEAQHAGIDAALGRVNQARTTWAGDPVPAHRDALIAELTALHALLSEHLDLEERAVLPLAAAHLSTAEWDAVGEAAAAAMPKPALALAFGMFAYEGDPEVLRRMLASAPALPRLLLPRIAPRLYAARARKVHGTASP